LPNVKTDEPRIAVFGPQAEQAVRSAELRSLAQSPGDGGSRVSLIGISSESSWGKASHRLIEAVYQDHVLGIITLDRASSHLAEQIGTKAFVPVIAISADRMLTSTNIPWIFRLPAQTTLGAAVQCMRSAIFAAGPNREKIRAVLGSGVPIGGMKFRATGEPE
jgi:hypothetical protein